MTQNVILSTLLAGFIQIGLIVAAFHLIGKAVGLRSLQLQDTLLLGVGVAITLYVALHTDRKYPALYRFFLPQTHVGSMLSVLYGWALALWIIRRRLDGARIRILVITVYATLCLLAGMSNLLFLPHMLAPLTAALLFLLFFKIVTLRDCWLPIILGWLATTSGAILNRLLFTVTDVSAQSGMALDRVLTSLDVFLRGFVEKVSYADMLHLGAIAYAGLCLGYIAWFLRRAVLVGRSELRKSQIIMATFFLASLLSSISSIVAIVLGGSDSLAVFKDYPWSFHYLHQVFLFPLFALVAAITWAIESSPNRRILHAISWTSAFVTILAVLMQLVRSPWPAIPIYAYRPPLVRFIDEIAPKVGLRYGYAGYWQARLITLLSRSGVRSYAVDGAMNPLLWVSNEQWYHHSLEDRSRPPPVDFVVLDDPLWKLSREAAVRVFGDPVSELRMQDTRVLIYRKNASALSFDSVQQPDSR